MTLRAALEDQILSIVRDVVGVGDPIHFGVDAVGGVHDRRPSAVASALGQLLLVVDTDGSRRDHPLAIDWHRIAPTIADLASRGARTREPSQCGSRHEPSDRSGASTFHVQRTSRRRTPRTVALGCARARGTSRAGLSSRPAIAWPSESSVPCG